MFRKLFFVFLVLFGGSFFLTRIIFSNLPEKESSTQTNKEPAEITPPIRAASPAVSQEELLKKIKNLFFETNPDIDFGIAVYDLKTGSYFGYNDVESQHAASVAKVLTAIYLLRQVKEDKIKLKDSMGTYNVEFNLKQMINRSNTISWEMIDDRLGIEPQNDFAHSIGLTSVNFRDNMMSPKDAASLFVKLYKGELLEEPYQKKLLSYMQDTETENLIPPAIPEGVSFYHKTGLFEGEVHDVAIIDDQSHPFVLAIFTVNKLMPDYEGRAVLIQKVAAEVYAFFERS